MTTRILMLLAALSAGPVRAYEFVFAPDGSTFACTADQKTKFMDAANALDDASEYARQRLVTYASVTPPPPSGDLDEIEFWLGDMPDGDPMHPSMALATWQVDVDQAADVLASVRSALTSKQFMVVCVAADFPACVSPQPLIDPGDAEDLAAAAFSIHVDMGGGIKVPTVGLCPKWFDLEPRGNYETRAPILGHELAHLFSPLFEVKDFVYDLLDCHEFRTDPRAAQNGATIQFLIGGLDARRSGGLGSTGIIPAIQMAVAIQGGCDVGGSGTAGGALWVLAALLLLGWRRGYLLSALIRSSRSPSAALRERNTSTTRISSIVPDGRLSPP